MIIIYNRCSIVTQQTDFQKIDIIALWPFSPLKSEGVKLRIFFALKEKWTILQLDSLWLVEVKSPQD